MSFRVVSKGCLLSTPQAIDFASDPLAPLGMPEPHGFQTLGLSLLEAVFRPVGLLPSGPLSGSVYNRFSQAYLRLLIGEIGGNSTKRPFRLPLDIATRLEKWI